MRLTDEQRDLAERYYPLVWWVLRKYFSAYPWHEDDLVSDGMRGLCLAAAKYDPGRSGATFKTYAAKVVYFSMITALRRLGARGRGGRLPPPSPVPNEGLDRFAVADPSPARVAARLDVGDMLARLPAADRDLLRLRFGLDDGVEVRSTELGARTGTPRSTVYTRVGSAVRRLQEIYA